MVSFVNLQNLASISVNMLIWEHLEHSNCLQYESFMQKCNTVFHQTARHEGPVWKTFSVGNDRPLPLYFWFLLFNWISKSWLDECMMHVHDVRLFAWGNTTSSFFFSCDFLSVKTSACALRPIDQFSSRRVLLEPIPAVWVYTLAEFIAGLHRKTSNRSHSHRWPL